MGRLCFLRGFQLVADGFTGSGLLRDGVVDGSSGILHIGADILDALRKANGAVLVLDIRQPDFIGGNTKLIAKLRACARRAGMYQTTRNDFGQQVEQYGSIPLVDLGAKPGTNDPIVPILDSGDTGCTSLYAVRFGLDGFHAVSPAGVCPVRQWLPDYRTAGAVKTGEVEMVAAVALKATKAAGVMRKIKVKA